MYTLLWSEKVKNYLLKWISNTIIAESISFVRVEWLQQYNFVSKQNVFDIKIVKEK